MIRKIVISAKSKNVKTVILRRRNMTNWRKTRNLYLGGRYADPVRIGRL